MAQLGHVWAQVGLNMRNVEVGPRQAPCGEHGLARTRRVGPGWAQVGALLANVDPKLSRCCGHVGRNGASGRCWTDLQNDVARLCPSLLNYHASASLVWADFVPFPGGFSRRLDAWENWLAAREQVRC